MSIKVGGLALPPDKSPESYYAVKVALQTMKERCQKLQDRLTMLEEENLQLRIERHQKGGKDEGGRQEPDVGLYRQVEDLRRQKVRLGHHIYMVASENKTLWQKMSKMLAKEKGDSGEDTVSVKPIKSVELLENWNENGGSFEESLEEISLKTLNSLIKGRKHSRQENTVNQVDFQNVFQDCEFRVSDKEDLLEDDSDYTLCEIKEVGEKVNSHKAILRQQHESLKKSFEAISKALSGGVPCKKCRGLKEPEPSAPLDSLEGTKETPRAIVPASLAAVIPNGFPTTPTKGSKYEFEDRICPLCAKFYSKSTPFNDFNDHVVSHFVQEDDGEPKSIISDYEMIT